MLGTTGVFRPLTTFVVALSALMATPVAAQTIPPGPLTLEQVLDIAEGRSESVAIAREGIRRAEGDRARARAGLFPQLNLSASYDRALASEFERVFEGLGGGLDDAASGGNAEASGTGGLEDLPFGRENTWRVSLSFSQNLFSGGRIGAQAAQAAAGYDTAALALTGARAQLLFDVTQAYYEAALSDRLVAIAEATVGQATATLRQAEAGFTAGTQPEFEVLRARVSRDTQNPVLIRQRVNREVALLRLKQLLDVPATRDLRLADSLSDEVLPPSPMFASRVVPLEALMTTSDALQAVVGGDAPLTDRAAVQEAEATVRLREAMLRAAEAQRRPSLSLTSNYGRVAYPSGTFPPFDDFRTNWTVGVNMQIPVLTGGRQRADEAIARAEVEQARLRTRQVEELAALDTRSAWAELLAARAAWEATAGTVQQAARAHEIAQVRYQAGVSTQLELTDARLLLQQAEVNRAQSARDLQVARARVALLPNLPVGGAGGQPQRASPTAPVQPSSPQLPAGGGPTRAAVAQGVQPLGGQQ